MQDLGFDHFGIPKEKIDPDKVKWNRGNYFTIFVFLLLNRILQILCFGYKIGPYRPRFQVVWSSFQDQKITDSDIQSKVHVYNQTSNIWSMVHVYLRFRFMVDLVTIPCYTSQNQYTTLFFLIFVCVIYIIQIHILLKIISCNIIMSYDVIIIILVLSCFVQDFSNPNTRFSFNVQNC